MSDNIQPGAVPANVQQQIARVMDPQLVEAGDVDDHRHVAWVLSELPEAARAYQSVLKGLPRDSVPATRYYAIDAIGQIADTGDAELVAAALAALNDQNPGIRQKALWLLAMLNQSLAAEAADFVDDQVLRQVIAAMPTAGETMTITFDQIAQRLSSDDRFIRYSGAAIALRTAIGDKSALQLASRNSDEHVATFAKEHLSKLR